jgi:hypothetical protein
MQTILKASQLNRAKFSNFPNSNFLFFFHNFLTNQTDQNQFSKIDKSHHIGPNLRSLTPRTTRVLGSDRSKFPTEPFRPNPDTDFGAESGSGLGYFPKILDTSKRSNPMAGTNRMRAHHLSTFLSTLRRSSLFVLPRKLRDCCFRRFRRARRSRDRSSDSSSETVIDRVWLLSMEDDNVGGGRQRSWSEQMVCDYWKGRIG